MNSKMMYKICVFVGNNITNYLNHNLVFQKSLFEISQYDMYLKDCKNCLYFIPVFTGTVTDGVSASYN